MITFSHDSRFECALMVMVVKVAREGGNVMSASSPVVQSINNTVSV